MTRTWWAIPQCLALGIHETLLRSWKQARESHQEARGEGCCSLTPSKHCPIACHYQRDRWRLRPQLPPQIDPCHP
jgi:hypothetical protein